MQEPNKGKDMGLKKAFLTVVALEFLLWGIFAIIYAYLTCYYPNEFHFRFPRLLVINLVVLPLYFLLFRQQSLLKKLVANIPSRLLAGFLTFPNPRTFWTKWLLYRSALFFLILALAQPLFGTKKGNALEKNSEVVIAMDVSNSMNTLDIDPKLSRLEIAKRATIELINGLQGERIGVLVFAGNAFVQLPMTSDYSTAKLFIQEIETKMLSNQGTNFDVAIDKAVGMFSEGRTGKCILMVTDGENHEIVPDEKLEDLPNKNIFLAVVGLGTKNGGLVLRDPEQPVFGYITDEKGRPVLSRVGTDLVKQMARKARGISLITDEPFPNLSNLLTEINQLNKGDLRNLELDIKETYYHWPLLIGLMIWLLSQISSFRQVFGMKKL